MEKQITNQDDTSVSILLLQEYEMLMKREFKIQAAMFESLVIVFLPKQTGNGSGYELTSKSL